MTESLADASLACLFVCLARNTSKKLPRKILRSQWPALGHRPIYTVTSKQKDCHATETHRDSLPGTGWQGPLLSRNTFRDVKSHVQVHTARM